MTVEWDFEEFLKLKVRFYQSVSNICHPGVTMMCTTRFTTESDFELMKRLERHKLIFLLIDIQLIFGGSFSAFVHNKLVTLGRRFQSQIALSCLLSVDFFSWLKARRISFSCSELKTRLLESFCPHTQSILSSIHFSLIFL